MDSRWSWKVDWRRDLLEGDRGRVEDLHSFLNHFSLTIGDADRWCWGDKKKGELSVKMVYKELVGQKSNLQLNHPTSEGLCCVWKAWAKLKAKFMA